jgi:hypothetical protein
MANEEICPRCGGDTEVDEVDIGVGMQQCGPRGCPVCHWVEGDPAALPMVDPDDGHDVDGERDHDPDEDRSPDSFDVSDVDGARW